METVLKPCPFCGGEGKLHTYRTFNEQCYGIREKYYIACESCGRGNSEKDVLAEYTRWKKDEAVEAWNRRANNGTSE